MSQKEVDHLFNAIVLPNFSYTLSVYGASDFNLSVIQYLLDRWMKRKYTSKNVNIRDLLEKADKTLYKKDQTTPNVRSSSFYLRKRKRGTILEIRQSLSLGSTLTDLRTFLVTE